MKKSFLFVMLLMFMFGITPAYADTLEVNEFQVTCSPAYETSPTLGNDGVSDLLVFTMMVSLGDGSFAPADIWYQRVADGGPFGPAVQVTADLTDDQLNDVSGDYMVYTAYDSVHTLAGTIMLYRISTRERWPLAHVDVAREARIHGNTVVWVQGGISAGQVMLYDLSWLGTAKQALIVAGPVPSASQVAIGNRYIAWAERVSGQYDIQAFDLLTYQRLSVTASVGIDDNLPSVSGDWVVWQSRVPGGTLVTIQAFNLTTFASLEVANNGAANLRPSVDGDLIAYESTLFGNLDIFVYRFSTGETFRVTTETHEQYLNDVFGNKVAYVDQRNGSEDIFISTLTFLHVPNPVLEVSGWEDYTVGDVELRRYNLRVTNWDAFPVELFERAPDLPPCGNNTNASRTWVDIYRQDGTKIYGFCNLDTPEALSNSLWFGLPREQEPPEYVYITLKDRRDNKTYTSNLAWTNLKPSANAGTDQTVHIGSTATLDGSSSTDPDEDYPLTYAWTITQKPPGSTAELSDPTAVSPSFVADRMGDYVIELTVTDSRGLSGTADSVLFSTYNTPPVADAGPDQALILLGTTVHLDGTQSFDLEGDTITYAWTMTQKPTGSTAALVNPASQTPTFVADKQGSYEIQLVVRDPWVQSSPDTVTISFDNVKPIADAGTSQSVQIGATVSLDGSGSSDANGDPLTYAWALVSVPDGSLSSIADPLAMTTILIPDLPGTYVVQLTVNDGYMDSDPGTIQVQAVTTQTEAIEAVQDLGTVIISLDPDVFKNENMQNTLLNKLNAVIANIEAGNYADALGQLEYDILGKTDGCAAAGAPDKNDWIKDCDAQNEVYPLIMEAIELVRSMI